MKMTNSNKTSLPGRLYSYLRIRVVKTPSRRRWWRGKSKRRIFGTIRKSSGTRLVAFGPTVEHVTTPSSPTAPAVIDVASFSKSPKTILVGDIGGTNARLAIWKVDCSNYTKIFEQWYPTQDFKEDGFVSVLRELCSNSTVQENYPSTACFAIAGPVSDNKAKMTNIGWLIDGESIQEEFNWKVALVNDFEALGYGIPLLDSSDLVVINDVPTQTQAPVAVLGPGTGLGEAQLMWDDGTESHRVWPSEGAHADFAPRNDIQRSLQRWIIDGYGYCELEHVACGAGLERIYTFLASEGQVSVTAPPLLTAPEVSKRALSGEDAIALDALDMMLSIIGAEAGHMGLRCLAHGGVYLAGGIIPKVIDRVTSGVVLKAFLHEEGHRFRSLLQSFRLCAVVNEEVGLIGCRHQATKLLDS